jgi:hypothetical protein
LKLSLVADPHQSLYRRHAPPLKKALGPGVAAAPNPGLWALHFVIFSCHFQLPFSNERPKFKHAFKTPEGQEQGLFVTFSTALMAAIGCRR